MRQFTQRLLLTIASCVVISFVQASAVAQPNPTSPAKTPLPHNGLSTISIVNTAPVRPGQVPSILSDDATFAHGLKMAELTTAKQSKRPAAGPKQPRDLWHRLIRNYALPKINHRRINQQIRYFSKRPDYFQRVQARAKPFLYKIVEDAEKSKLPGEIALLPVVESAFRTQAYSHSHAAGIWQFISATGQRYGLKQSGWYDGRRDVYASTQAAIKHLKHLHRKFNGDWMLALAAYNSGAGKVARAIKRNRRLRQPVNFWALKLPRETRYYVPQLLAVAKIFANPKKYGIPRYPVPDQPYFEAVDIGSQLDLALAAQMANLPVNEIYQLNPGFSRWATDPDGPHRLLIPRQKSKRFRQNLASLPPQKRVRSQRHTIRNDETLGHIAIQYKTDVKLLKEANSLKNDRIQAGQTLLIPLATQKLSYYKRSTNNQLAGGNSNGTLYKVRRGDTLWDIAKAHSISHKKLAVWNDLSVRDHLLPGQTLIVSPKNMSRVQTLSANVINYTVKKGDSLSVIAHKFKVKVRDLLRWNPTRTGKYIKPGQIFLVYLSGAKPAT